MVRTRSESIREWEDNEDNQDYYMEELLAHNVAQGVEYWWDCSTSRGYGDDDEPIDLVYDDC